MDRRVMKLWMRCLVSGIMIISGFVSPPRALAQDGTVTIDRKIPFDQVVSTPCADKEIRLTGDLQAQFRVKSGADGSYVEADFNSEGITGVGVTSGNKYQAAGTGHFDSDGPAQLEFTYTISFVLNRPGTYDSVMVHANLRITLKPKNEVTVVVSSVNIDCNK